MKCEKCLSRTNCQFLGAHKKAIVEDCTAFRSEEQYVAKIRAEAIKDFADWANEKGYLWSKEDVDQIKAEAIKKIFDKLEERLCVHTFTSKSEEYADGQCDCMEWVDGKIDELKKELGYVE